MNFSIAAWACCLGKDGWIYPVGAWRSQHFPIEVFELTLWCRADESLGDRAGGCEELPRGRAEGGGAGRCRARCWCALGAARTGLVSLRGCSGTGETLLWDPTYQWWMSPTGSSSLSPWHAAWTGPPMCVVFLGGCCSTLWSPTLADTLLLFSWFPSAASHCSLGTRHEAFPGIFFL